jgi:hypothetical protein
MALDWTYFEENRGRYREGGIGLESTGCTETRSSKKNVEEEGGRRSCSDGKDLEGSEEIGQQSYSMERFHRCPMLQLGATGN